MGNSSSKITSQDRAILEMKTQRDKLRQYQKKIRVVTDREIAIAKDCLKKGQKDKALLALRKKKYQESLLSQTDQQLEQLERLTNSVEFALVQKDVMFGLQRGTEVLNQINREMGGIENVERIMGDNEQARREAEEISDALGGKLSNNEEDEVEDELEALEREINKIDLPTAPQEVLEGNLPAVPDTVIETEDQKLQRQKERARRRREEALQAA